jgi:hypothetical protein
LEIKETVEAAYGDKALKKTAIYAIINKVKKGETTADQRHLSARKLCGPRLSSPLSPPPLRMTAGFVSRL